MASFLASLLNWRSEGSQPRVGVASQERVGVTTLVPALTFLFPRLWIYKIICLSSVVGFLEIKHTSKMFTLLHKFRVGSSSPAPLSPEGVSSGRPVSWSPPPECRVISFFHHIAAVVCAPVVAACRLNVQQLRRHEKETPPLHLVG